eukprot:220922-Pyramimonas_sp.AAC.1
MRATTMWREVREVPSGALRPGRADTTTMMCSQRGPCVFRAVPQLRVGPPRLGLLPILEGPEVDIHTNIG